MNWQLTSADIRRWPTHSIEAYRRHCMTYQAVSETKSFVERTLQNMWYLNPITANRMALKNHAYLKTVLTNFYKHSCQF